MKHFLPPPVLIRISVLVCLIHVCSFKSSAQVTESDSIALVALYNATDGDSWIDNTNWLVTNVGEWFGVMVESGQITRIDLDNNSLSGTIPADLSNLASLEILYLYKNDLTGSIPSELGNMTSLEQLYLFDNYLTGSIPVELGSLTNLVRLYLYGNQLTGSIPVELGNLSNLERLQLYENQLTGSIPAEFGNFSKLNRLYLYDNLLSGVIPTELGNVNNPDLLNIDLHNNLLEGSVPSSFANLTELNNLNIRENRIDELPDLTSLTNLFYFDISWNIIPQEDIDLNSSVITDNEGQQNTLLSDSLALVALYDSTDGDDWTNNTNWLTGPVDEWYGITVEEGRVTSVDLTSNNLSGSIPSELGSLLSLSELFASGNQLTGSIPATIGNLTNLLSLRLSNNQFTGSIPSELGNLVNLSDLYLSGNQLMGSIPSELGNISNLRDFTVSDNQLTGSIPSELGNLTKLWRLFASRNQLAGSIPAELGNLSILTTLSLFDNQLTGSIPSELGELKNLVVLSIYDNQIIGSVPSELGNLADLRTLDIYNNQLSGPIPSTFLSLDLGRFWFTGTDLCEPNYAEYNTWKSEITNYNGTNNSCELVIWAGTTDSDWNTSSNWEGGIVPTETDDVIIPNVSSASMNDPIISGDFAVNDIHVESGGNLTIESGASLAVFGTATGDSYQVVKDGMNVAGGDDSPASGGYNLMGSLVKNQKLNSATCSHVDYAYSYDGTSFSGNMAGTDYEMIPGKGYFLGQDDVEPYYEFEGTINSGTIDIDLISPSEFHLVSNPYTAAISRADFLAENDTDVIDGALYFWDDGGSNNGSERAGVYVTVDAAGNVVNGTFDGNIRSAQGFWVYTATSPTVSFNPSMQITTTNANSDDGFYRVDGSKEEIKLTLTNGTISDELLINLAEESTLGIDQGLDVHKLTNPAINFYSLIESQKFAIQTLPTTAEEVPIGFSIKESGPYEIQADLREWKGMATLMDTKSGVSYDLNQTTLINLELSNESVDDRFMLHLEPTITAVADKLYHLELEIYQGGSTLLLRQDKTEEAEVGLYNLAGQEIYRDKLSFKNGNARISGLSLRPGNLYLLKSEDFEPIKFVLK